MGSVNNNNNSDGFVRADKIDLKRLDEQLQRHISRSLTLDKQQQKKSDNDDESESRSPTPRSAVSFKEDWEIEPSKLLIKSVIARGTFGTVHRGVYDGLDVAGLGFARLKIESWWLLCLLLTLCLI